MVWLSTYCCYFPSDPSWQMASKHYDNDLLNYIAKLSNYNQDTFLLSLTCYRI